MSNQTPTSNPPPAPSPFTIAQTQRTEQGQVASKTTTISGPLLDNPVNPRSTSEGKNAHARGRRAALAAEKVLPGDDAADLIALKFGMEAGKQENLGGMNSTMNQHGTWRRQEIAIAKVAKTEHGATIKGQATVLPHRHSARPSYYKLTAQDQNGKTLSGNGLGGDNVVFANPLPNKTAQQTGPKPQAPKPSRSRSR